MKEMGHVAYFDIAYQGFATGSFDDDGFSVRYFAEQGVECLVAQSFSKNFGIYGQRAGCAHIIHSAGEEVTLKLQKNLYTIVRNTWSLSPVYGAQIVQVVGEHPEMLEQLIRDVATMGSRMASMRSQLYEALMLRKAPGNWEALRTGSGMFALAPLGPAHADYLRTKHHIYIVSNGRVNVCGLTQSTIGRVADAFVDALLNCK